MRSEELDFGRHAKFWPIVFGIGRQSTVTSRKLIQSRTSAALCSPEQSRRGRRLRFLKAQIIQFGDELTMNGIDLNAIEKRRLAWLLFRHPALACFIRDFLRGTSKFAVLQECSAVELLWSCPIFLLSPLCEWLIFDLKMTPQICIVLYACPGTVDCRIAIVSCPSSVFGIFFNWFLKNVLLEAIVWFFEFMKVKTLLSSLFRLRSKFDVPRDNYAWLRNPTWFLGPDL